MSCIPYTTQAEPVCSPEGSQPLLSVFIIYHKNMTPYQSRLMKDCQDYLHNEVETFVKDTSEICEIPNNARFFVIPSIREELVKQLRKLSQHQPCIYTPRAIIESRVRKKIQLPVRSIAISLSMLYCHVFLTKSCNSFDIRTKINQMCGTVVPSFNDPHLNVLVTDRADDKYCIKARQLSLACVTRAWVIENHRDSQKEDEKVFDFNALIATNKHQVKPFFGLIFKISTKHSESYIKNIIAENQGRVVYGDANCVTHEVIDEFIPTSYEAVKEKTKDKTCRTQVYTGPKRVDVLFIRACAELGYYLTLDEYMGYRESEEDRKIIIKQEPICQLTEVHGSISSYRPPGSMSSDECFTPPAPPSSTRHNAAFATPQLVNGCTRLQASQRSQSSENQFMLPPLSVTRQTRLQQQQQQNNLSESMNDVILKALSGFENGTVQTQLASTQMRGLPERAIQIEQTMEPSQQLYWSDTVSRRH